MLGKTKPETSQDKKNWYVDRYQAVVVQRNILFFVTVLSLLCSIAAGFSISQLAPLKSVEPFVIQVDQKTGVTQVVDPLKAKELTVNEAVNDYFIVQYVRARESYIGSPSSNFLVGFNIVRVFSSPAVFTEYQRSITVTNTDSPAARLGNGGERDVHVSSIKFLDQRDSIGETIRRYLVKAQISEKMAGATNAKVSQKLILIEFKYTELDLTTEDRYLNPIGFRVLNYKVDDDNLNQ